MRLRYMTLAVVLVQSLYMPPISGRSLSESAANGSAYSWPSDAETAILTIVSTASITGRTFTVRVFGDGRADLRLDAKGGNLLRSGVAWLEPRTLEDLARIVVNGRLSTFNSTTMVKRMKEIGPIPGVSDGALLDVSFVLESLDDETSQVVRHQGAAALRDPEVYAEYYPTLPELQALAKLGRFSRELWTKVNGEGGK